MAKMCKSLLSHEIFFGLFLLITWVRVAFCLGPFHVASLVGIFFILLNALIIYFSMDNESPDRWKTRLLFYPFCMILSFAYLGVVVPVIHPGLEDLFLQNIDSFLIGGNLSLLLEPFIHPVITEIMSLCYVVFFVYLFCSITLYIKKHLVVAQNFFAGLFTIFGIGFLSYTLFPALGPYEAMAAKFSIPLTEGSIFTYINTLLIPLASNHVDVFPSLHCSISAYLLFFDRTHSRQRYKRYLPICIIIWISTIYLRYHYFIDVMAGFVLAAFALWIANIYKKGHHFDWSLLNKMALVSKFYY